MSVVFLIGIKLGYPAGQEGKIYDSGGDVMGMMLLLILIVMMMLILILCL